MKDTNSVGFVFALGALSAVSATAIDICIPAQPDIARSLGARPEAGAALVTGYLLGYGPCQIFWGPLSDRFGRRLPLTVAILGFLIASVVCALANSLELLTGARFVQGMFGGGAPVIARAIARDAGGGSKTASLLSTMTIILGIAPLVAPAIGSGLLTLADWRWIFWSLVVFGVLLLVSTHLYLADLKPAPAEQEGGPIGLLAALRRLSVEPVFLFGVGVGSLMFCGYAALLAVGAAAAEDRYGVAPEAYGPIFAILALAFVAGSIAARQTLPRFGTTPVFIVGAGAAAVSGTVLGVNHAEPSSILVYWSLLGAYTAAFGALLPTSMSHALEPAGEYSGLASSILGSIMTLAGAASAAIAGSGLLPGAYSAICLTMAVTGIGAALLVGGAGIRRLAAARIRR